MDVRTETVLWVRVRLSDDRLIDIPDGRSFWTKDGELHVGGCSRVENAAISVYAPSRWLGAEIVKVPRRYDADTGQILAEAA